MKTNFTFLWEELKAMAIFASEDETRYVLNGVYVQLDCEREYVRPLFVATDGRRMAALRGSKVLATATSHERVTFIIPNTLLKLLPEETCPHCRPKPDEESELAAHWSGQEFTGEYDTETKRVRLVLPDYVLEAPAIKGNFPNFRQVAPSGNGGAMRRMVVNIELLHSFHRAFGYLYPNRQPEIIVRQRETFAPLEIACRHHSDFYGLLMPMKAFDEEFAPTAPEWFLAK